MNAAPDADRAEWEFIPNSTTEDDALSDEDNSPLEQWKQRTNRRVAGEEEAFD
jgi:hypothetical protein